MYSKRKTPALCSILLTCLFLLMGSAQMAYAQAPIGKVANFEGDVIILRGEEVIKVSSPGQVLNEGDRVQTNQGTVEIQFEDKAVMKLRPFTNTMLQEREEKSGFLVFKTTKMVRRVTCFVGKLWFNSGDSNKKNILQTPTMVCGLRGTETDFGFNPAKAESYINFVTGDGDVTGSVIRGFFEDPGIDAAVKSAVFQALENAHTQALKAQETGKDLDKGKATLEVYKAVQTAAVELQKNPESKVAQEAQVVSLAAKAGISAAEAVVKVEEVKEVQKTAEATLAEAKAKGDEKTAKIAEIQLTKATEAVNTVQKAAQETMKAKEEVVKNVADAQKAIANDQKVDIKKIEASVETVNKNADTVKAVVDTNLAVAKVQVAAEMQKQQAEEQKTKAEEAKAAGNTAAAEEAEKKAEEAEKKAEEMENAAEQAEESSQKVNEAAIELDHETVQQEAAKVEEATAPVQEDVDETLATDDTGEASPT